jgi:hypothetical protein
MGQTGKKLRLKQLILLGSIFISYEFQRFVYYDLDMYNDVRQNIHIALYTANKSCQF